MNRISQPDLHPDTEVLSAFAEQALPPAERTVVLAHMSKCPRCREIVYLAQAETEASRPVPALSNPDTSKARPSRALLPKWRIAWAPAAALAGACAIVLWVFLRPVPPAATVAMNAPREPVCMAAPPAQTQASETQKLQTDAIQPDKPSASRIPAPFASHNASSASSARASRLQELTKAPRGTSDAIEPPPPSASGASVSAFAPTSLAAASPVQKSTLFARPAAQNGLTNTQWQPSTPQEMAQPVHPQSLSLSSAQSPSLLSVESSAPPAVPPALPSLAAGLSLHGQARFPLQSLNGPASLRSNQPVSLPNGLTSVSTAAIPGLLLAIDPDGAVFLSSDAGKSWNPVSPQWTGKALEVRALSRYFAQSELLQASATSRAADSSSSAPQAPVSAEASPAIRGPELITPTFFRLVTDRHQTWVSLDGKAWRLQQ